MSMIFAIDRSQAYLKNEPDFFLSRIDFNLNFIQKIERKWKDKKSNLISPNFAWENGSLSYEGSGSGGICSSYILFTW